MAIRTNYHSSGWEIFSDSTGNETIYYSSQIVIKPSAGFDMCVPVVTAATSGQNPAFGHLSITGSSSSALNYYLEAPTSPYGQRLTVTCLMTSTSTRQAVWASTDGSVTFDGTNQVAVFTSSASLVSNSFQAVSVSSARWHITGFSTTNLLFSTQSS